MFLPFALKKISGVNKAWFFLFSLFLNNMISALPWLSDAETADKYAEKNYHAVIWIVPGECLQARLSPSEWPGSTHVRSPKETLWDLLHYARKHPGGE